MKKIMACILSISLLLTCIPSFVSASNSLPLNIDFSADTAGEKPSGIDSVIEDGSVTVEDYYGTRMIYVKNNTDGRLAQVSKKFEKVSNTVVNIRFKYMQRYAKQDEATVFALTDGVTDAVKISTSGSDMISTAADGTETVLVEKYQANKWYNFELTVNLQTATYTVTVNDRKRFKDIGFLNAVTECDGFKSQISYSPGFALAEIALSTGEAAERVEISGTDTMSVKKLTESEYEFDAVLYDNFGNIVTDAEYSWSVSPSGTSGMTVTPNGDKLKIKLDSSASYRGVVTIAVTANPSTDCVTAVKYVNMIGQDVAEIKFEGSHKIAYGIEPDNTFVLDTLMYSKDGEELDNEAVDWKITNGSNNVTITKEDTRLIFTVTGELGNRDKIDIKAILKSNRTVTADFLIYTYPQSVYEGDQSRWDMVLESVDYLVNDLAKNEYSDLPLFPTFLNLKTKKAERMETKYQGDMILTDLATNTVKPKEWNNIRIHYDTLNETQELYVNGKKLYSLKFIKSANSNASAS